MAQLLSHGVELDLKDGVQVYYLSPKSQSWQVGTICGTSGPHKLKVKDDETGDVSTVEKHTNEVHKFMENGYSPADEDLFSMNDLHSSTLLWCVSERFEGLKQQYTRMGEIILSMNPFEGMPYNRPEVMDSYVAETDKAPHCWQVAPPPKAPLPLQHGPTPSIRTSRHGGECR